MNQPSIFGLIWLIFGGGIFFFDPFNLMGIFMMFHHHDPTVG